MAIRRVCSYEATFITPEVPSTYSAMLLTIWQNGNAIINKDMSELTIGETDVTVKLTQEETALLEANTPAYIQLRCYAEPYNAPGSAVFPIDVNAALNDTILS